MKTFGQLRDQIIAQVWPSGQPEGLEDGHRALFQEGMGNIVKWVGADGGEEYQQNQVNVVRFCKTQYKCGMTVFEAPRGIIRRIYTVCNDQFCDPVYYQQVEWPQPEWLGRRAMLHSNSTGVASPNLRLGFSDATAENDSKCGRARNGVWAIWRGNIYLSPWIQSTEFVVVEWEGTKSEWSDEDPVDDRQDFRATLKLWYQYGHERDYGSPERAVMFHNAVALRDPSRAGAFDVALAELMWRIREEIKVRRTPMRPADPWCYLGQLFDQCLPPTTVGPLVFGHIGNYGQQGYGETSAFNLLAAIGSQAVFASGLNATEGYDLTVGQYFHGLISPYTGDYGDGGQWNAFWPAPSAVDWGINSLADFKDFFTLPNNERYYDVCFGPVHLFVIDSNASDPDGIAEGSAQGVWLKAKLALSNAPWKVVVMSTYITLPYSDWGANLVLATADGYYERRSVGGIPVIQNGLGGNNQTGGAVSAQPDSMFLQQRGISYGAGRILATRCSIRFEMISASNGQIIDSVQLDKPKTGECAQTSETLAGATLTEFLPSEDTPPVETVASQQVFNWPGDPNGNVTAGPLPSVCYDTLNNITWWKTDGVVSNTGWH